MTKFRKIIASLLLIVIAFSLSSCGTPFLQKIPNGPCGPDPWEFYPEGYTAGFPSDAKSWKEGAMFEVWWVETYEECIEAIELLKSHGSKFCNGTILSHDGDLFDTKYRFTIFLSDSTYQTESIQFGENPFDRRAMRIYVDSYVFFEDVTIDELNYGDIEDYNVYYVNTSDYEKAGSLLSTDYTYEWIIDDKSRNICNVYQGDKLYFSFIRLSNKQNDSLYMSDECVKALIKSIKTISTEGVMR